MGIINDQDTPWMDKANRNRDYDRPADLNPARPSGDPDSHRRRQLNAIAVAVVLILSLPALQAQELIANPDWPAAPLDLNQARLYFTLRLKLLDNRIPVNVFVLPDEHPLHRRFAKNILGLFPYQLRQVWDRQLFSGTGQVPITVTTEQEMVERVAATPGAIGYVESGSNLSQVRILEVR